MRVTNEFRTAFVSGVMNDLPQIDYTEQIRKIATEDLMAQVPAEVMALFNSDLKGYVHCVGFNAGRLERKEKYSSGGYSYNKTIFAGVTIFGIPGPDKNIKLTANGTRKVNELVKLHVKQEEQRAELEKKIRSACYAFNTRKTLAQALPEFEKYMPKDVESANRMVPTVVGVVDAFKKAGWPTPKKKPAVAVTA